MRPGLFHRRFRSGDVDGQQAAIRGVAIVLGPVAVEHEVTLAEDRAVAFVKLSVQDPELFVTVVARAARLASLRPRWLPSGQMPAAASLQTT